MREKNSGESTRVSVGSEGETDGRVKH